MQFTKSERHNAIKDVIFRKKIASQEDLRIALADHGIEISQATLSRDLQELGVVKSHGTRPVHYVINAERTGGGEQKDSSILSIEVSGNLAIVKTLPGHASMYAGLIDRKNFEEIAGTLAGDDTIFVALRKNVSEIEAYQTLGKILPIQDKD